MDVASSPYSSVAVQYAGFGIRFVAWLVDYVILLIIYFVLRAISGSLIPVSYIIDAAYYTALIGSSMQASVGMRVFNLKVIPDGGSENEPIGYVKAFLRWLVSLVSFAVVGLGMLWIIWDPKKQGWHDKAVGSVVVRAS